MIRVLEAVGKRYGVVGLGKAGRAAIASLLHSGAEVLAWDDKEAARAAVQKEFPQAKMLSLEEWTNLAAVVMSPGIALSHPAVEVARRQKAEVLGEVELLWRSCPSARYVGITGTNGKSTTTTLIAHILSACGKRVQVGGNLGTPSLALEPLGTGGIYVLEMSSYQLDLMIRGKFDTALLLNISPDHLDHHGSMDAYIAAKKVIFARQEATDTAVVGIDDPVSEAIARELIARDHQRVVPVSATQAVRHGISAAGGRIEGSSLEGIASLQGEHNWQNAAAAYGVCRAEGCAHADIMKAMADYPGLAHRMQWLGEHRGIRFINDSKATNADAAEKALKTYDGIYWIIGGVAKEGGIEPLQKYFPKIRHAYLIGEAAERFAQTLGDVPKTRCGTLEKAFAAATADAARDQRQPVVLLSPACASFDQFPNFEVRGEAFMKMVEAFAGGESHAQTA
jgi:UDP-N-acetylmuramoylalanine--D-glutamate ligase